MKVTVENLRALGPRGKRSIVSALAQAADDVLPAYKIDANPRRMAHFWAQAAHECDGFKTLEEYWGPTPAQKRYEGRKDLGNTQPGDGYRFRGRGIFQLTGRDNYARMSKKLGIDLIADPDKAADPVISLKIACEYWQSRKLNALADKNDIETITRRINGGLNGYADRRARFRIAWDIWGDEDKAPIGRKTLTQSREVAAQATTAAGSGVGVYAAYEVGREGLQNATEIRETAQDAGNLVGLDGSMALLIGGALLVAGGLGYLFYRRWRRSRVEEA